MTALVSKGRLSRLLWYVLHSKRCSGVRVVLLLSASAAAVAIVRLYRLVGMAANLRAERARVEYIVVRLQEKWKQLLARSNVCLAC